MTEEHKELNNWLRETYGKSITGKTSFRLVWSNDITEKRRGQFNEFYGKIFLRTVTGIRELPKYNYIHNRYILEIWVGQDLSSNGEVPDAIHGDYAPVWVFENSEGNPLPVTRKVLAFLIAAVQKKVKQDTQIDEKTAQDLEIDKMVESFDDHPGWLKTSGAARNSVAYDKGLRGK
jgi:hypothetical protein